MSNEATRETVNALYAAYKGGDIESFFRMVDDDITWSMVGPVTVFPFGGVRKGKAAVRGALATLGQHYRIERHDRKVMIVEDDWASLIIDAAFLQLATGRTITVRLANFLRLHNGKLIEFQEFGDTFDVVEQAMGRWLAVEAPPHPAG